MAGVMVVVIVIAFVVAWNALIYARSGGRGWSPVWMAFNSTAAAALFLLAGFSGYTLSRHDRFLANTAWTGQVLWGQVSIGVVAALAAWFFWRVGLRQPLHRRASRA